MSRSQIIMGTILLITASCQAPKEPTTSSVKTTSGTNTETSGAANSNSGSQTFFAGGANVGTPEMKTMVSNCLNQKTFFNRVKSECTALPLANVNCKSPEIRGIMSDAQKESFDTYLGSDLAGYVLDQCLDCTNPTSSPLCAGTTSQTSPGVRLFLVKESGGSILNQTLYIKTASKVAEE